MTEELTPDQRSALRYALGRMTPYTPNRREYFAAAAPDLLAEVKRLRPLADAWLRASRECVEPEAAASCVSHLAYLDAEKEIERLRAALEAAIGYMTNAAIDLQTAAPKKTALATIKGGINQARAALTERTP